MAKIKELTKKAKVKVTAKKVARVEEKVIEPTVKPGKELSVEYMLALRVLGNYDILARVKGSKDAWRAISTADNVNAARTVIAQLKHPFIEL